MFIGHYALGLAEIRVTQGALTVVAAIGGALFTAWSWWVDRHRTTVSAP